MKKILFIVGSERKASFNRQLADYTASILEGKAEVEFLNYGSLTFINHDILEAVKISDKMLVLDGGQMQQFGSPKEILEKPETEFVANLVEMVEKNRGM